MKQNKYMISMYLVHCMLVFPCQ